MPQPAVLGRNGTFVAWRKLHTRVAAFRKYLHDNASGPDEESLLAAKIVGRWPSGAPLILAPERDDPALRADDQRNNNFLYQDADPRGLLCPHGAHLERQFEFIKSQWLNDGNFTGLDREKDLLVGDNDGTGDFTIPGRPIRRRLHGVERFVITRGGEYCFLPSLSALRWLATLGA